MVAGMASRSVSAILRAIKRIAITQGNGGWSGILAQATPETQVPGSVTPPAERSNGRSAFVSRGIAIPNYALAILSPFFAHYSAEFPQVRGGASA